MKICCIHPWVKDIPTFLKFSCLDGRIDPSSLEWSETEPDILFGTEWIYYRSDMFRKFSKLYSRAGIKVGYFGEAVEVDWNIFDYGIGFSDRENDDRFIRILSPADMYRNFISSTENELSDSCRAMELLKSKPGFCNFLYSNPEAHPMRDRIFHELCGYKKVDSLGKHLNNTGRPGTGYGNGHAADCIGIKSGYKFSIASENACFSGYTSEKIFTSLEAHTVPIYWGNPNIKDDINPDSFINVADYPSLDAAIDRIREIDCNDDLWAEMVCAPWRTPQQVEEQSARTNRYYEGMAGLLSGKLSPVAPAGFHPDLYKNHFLSGIFRYDRSFLDKLKSRLRHK